MAGNKMNFLVIMSDTFRFDLMDGFRGARPRFRAVRRNAMTPNLDRFARRCFAFERAYCGAFPTVPNRKDLFTGRTTFPFEGRWSPLSADAVTFIACLGRAGYETMTVQDCPHLIPKAMCFERDFDGYLHIPGQEGYPLASWRHDRFGDATKTRAAGQLFQHMANVEMVRRSEEDCFSAQTLRQAAYWLERRYDRDPNGPFLLYLDCFDPHEPWDAPQWYEDLYDPGWTGEQVIRYPGEGMADAYTKAELDHMRALYAAEVTMVDRWIGHLFETMDRMGLFENTCVIFTSDHGYNLGEHGLVNKQRGRMYEEICHVPLLIHLPGQARATRRRQLVQTCDLAPTMLDLAGVEIPEPMMGRSLRPLMEGARGRLREFAFSGYFRSDRISEGAHRRMTITSADWALAYDDSSAGTQPELYHLKTDPDQRRNVLKKNLRRAQRMWDAYARWLENHGAPDDFNAPPRP